MITAMQSAKLQTAVKLLEAKEKIVSCLSVICLDPVDRKKLRQALDLIDSVAGKVLPSNAGPKNDGS